MRSLISSLAFLGCVLGSSLAADLKPGAVELFKWFETLGYPDLSKAPFGVVSEGTKEPYHIRPVFLLRSDEKFYTLLQTDLCEFICPKTTRPDQSPRYTEESFRPTMEAWIREIRTTPAREWPRLQQLTTNKLYWRGRLFVLAYAAWQRRETTLAAELFDLSQHAPAGQDNSGNQTKLSYRDDLEYQLAQTATWQTVLLFGPDGAKLPPGEESPVTVELLSRPELLDRFREIARLYPRNRDSAMVTELTSQLEQMVSEDKTHPKLTAEEISGLPVEEQVREWIFQLRDQQGIQLWQPGECLLFLRLGLAVENSPAYQLARIGRPAIPQLIAALDDYRPIRAVQFHRSHYFSHRPLTVGDAVLQTINKIAGKNFGDLRMTSPPYNPERAAGARREAEAWWQEKNKATTNNLPCLSAGFLSPRHTHGQPGLRTTYDTPCRPNPPSPGLKCSSLPPSSLSRSPYSSPCAATSNPSAGTPPTSPRPSKT